MEAAFSNAASSEREAAASNATGSERGAASSNEARSQTVSGSAPAAGSEAGSAPEATSSIEARSPPTPASPTSARSQPEPRSARGSALSTAARSQRSRDPAARAARHHRGRRGAPRLGRGPRPARRPAPPCSGRARCGSEAWSLRVTASSTSMRTNVGSITKEPANIRTPGASAGLRHERGRAPGPRRGGSSGPRVRSGVPEHPLAPEPGLGSGRSRAEDRPPRATPVDRLERGEDPWRRSQCGPARDRPSARARRRRRGEAPRG